MGEAYKEYDESDRAYAAELARGISQEMFGKDIYIRGIVEFSNICKTIAFTAE